MNTSKLLGVTRIALGLIFLWAFFDKLLGLGFATAKENAWIAGGSPTSGFLLNAVHGPLSEVYHALAKVAVVDWIFMIALTGIGIGLTLGIATRLSCFSGVLLMFLMWSALLPPQNHPFIDDHIIYGLVLLVLYYTNADEFIGLGKQWKSLSWVQKSKVLI